MLIKNSRFFGACSPSKLVYIGSKGSFRKISGQLAKKGYLKIWQRGGKIPEKGGTQNPLLTVCIFFLETLFIFHKIFQFSYGIVLFLSATVKSVVILSKSAAEECFRPYGLSCCLNWSADLSVCLFDCWCPPSAPPPEEESRKSGLRMQWVARSDSALPSSATF